MGYADGSWISSIQEDNRGVEGDMTIELTQNEHGFLVTLLEEKQHELLHEISKADVREFQRELREREVVLEGLLRKLGTAVGSTTV